MIDDYQGLVGLSETISMLLFGEIPRNEKIRQVALCQLYLLC